MSPTILTDQEALDVLVARIGSKTAEELLTVNAWTIEGRNMLVRAIDRAKEGEARAAEQQTLTLDDRRTLQGEVDAGLVRLQVYACPDCGCRISDQTVRNRSWPPRCFECNGIDEQDQDLTDGRPMVPTEIPVRKLPDAFKHLDSALRLGINATYIAKLVREIDSQRQATVHVRDVGFAHNARVVLRFAAARAGVYFEGGAVRVLGDGQDARVHFSVDPTEGVGAT